MTLCVLRSQAKLLTLDVNPSDTAQDVKGKIQNLESILLEFQRLNYNQQPLTDYTKTLSDYMYKIKPNSTLGLGDATPIYIMTPSCRTITIDMDPRNPMLQLKETLQGLEGIPGAQQKVFFPGKRLDYRFLSPLDIMGETFNSLTLSANLWVTNIKTAVNLWITNQASAASTYGLVQMWVVSFCGHLCSLLQTQVCSARRCSRGATMALLWACMMTSTVTLTMAAVIDLATLANPYSGSTLGNADEISVCGSGPEQGFSYALAPGRRIVIGQKSNNFDSMHTLRYGGQYPGEVEVSCIDDSDEDKIEFNNTGVNTVTVYFIIDGFDGDSGDFTLEWDVPCPAGTYSAVMGATSSATCSACTAGGYCPAGSSAVTSCPAGTYSAVMGATSSSTCSACIAGSFVSRVRVLVS